MAGPMIDAKDLKKAAATGMRAASRRSDIGSFMVMDVMVEAAKKEAAGDKVIHMEVGQPATPAPKAARDAAAQAMKHSTLGYTTALGIPELRERIAMQYKQWYGLDVAPSRIIVTGGSSAAFVLAFLTLFDVGDKVAVPSPGYPCYRQILTALGQQPHIVETGPATRWMPTIDQLDAVATEIQGLLLASPANPTGTMLEPERLAAIAELCKRRKIWLISDEIYHGLTYEMPAQTALAHSDQAIAINSFSKYFSMTGWRIGWMVIPEQLVATVERLAQNFYICPPAISQIAALGAFDGYEELESNIAVYKTNRNLLLQEFPRIGFDQIAPADGAFFLYCDVSRYTDDSLSFAQQMLEETGVAATSGIDFDAARGNRFMRFSFSGSTELLSEGIDRLSKWQRLKI